MKKDTSYNDLHLKEIPKKYQLWWILGLFLGVLTLLAIILYQICS